MRFSAPDIHNRVAEAVARLQDDGGVFRRFTDKYHLEQQEFWLITRFRYFPGSATPQDFLTFGPYTSVSRYQSGLEALVGKAAVKRDGENRYKLAESMRKALADAYGEFFARLARLTAWPEEQAGSQFELLDRVYAAALHQSEVPVPILSAAHSVLPDLDAIGVQVERRLVGLSIYRDESHIAAWREADYTGPRIELSTHLFQAESGLTHDELRERADRLDDKDFVSALSALHSGGEVVQREERYRLSKAGRATREEIEAATDRNYLKPFAALEEDEFDRLIELLKNLAPESH